MTNFILIDAPDFVLVVASTQQVAPHPFGRPHYLNPAFSELVRLLDPTLGVGECSSALTLEGAAHRSMRRILLQYGFDLPPIDVGELHGLLDYCDRLDAITGSGFFSARQILRWQDLSGGLSSHTGSPGRRALSLYSSGDLTGLRRLHREQDTLAQLGLAFRRAARSMSHPALPL